MDKKLLQIAKKIRTTEPFENKEWIELSFNYGKWIGEEYDEFAIEWVASYVIGENRDNISIQHNYFGNTPKEALNKLCEELKVVKPSKE